MNMVHRFDIKVTNEETSYVVTFQFHEKDMEEINYLLNDFKERSKPKTVRLEEWKEWQRRKVIREEDLR